LIQQMCELLNNYNYKPKANKEFVITAIHSKLNFDSKLEQKTPQTVYM